MGIVLGLLFSGVVEAGPKRRLDIESGAAVSGTRRQHTSPQASDSVHNAPSSSQPRTRAQQRAATATVAAPSVLESTAPTAITSSTAAATAPTEQLRLVDILMHQLERHLARRRVLSIDGGGVRGAFAAQVLVRLEAATGQSIGKLFQGSITGTSTGSLIALGLLSPDKEDQPGAGPYTAAEIVDFYRERASHMFSGCCAAGNCIRSSRRGYFGWTKNLLSCFRCCGCFHNCKSVCGPRYTREALDAELQALLGSTIPLKEALGPVQTTTYDISRGGGEFCI